MAIVNKGGAIKPTHLLYKSNLSHTLMKEYLAELISKKFIEEQPVKRGKNFTITEKGRKFSREYKKMKELSIRSMVCVFFARHLPPPLPRPTPPTAGPEKRVRGK